MHFSFYAYWRAIRGNQMLFICQKYYDSFLYFYVYQYISLHVKTICYVIIVEGYLMLIMIYLAKIIAT